MKLVSTGGDVIGAILVFLCGIVISVIIGRKFGTKPGRSLAIYGWHTFFCVAYAFYGSKYGGDSIAYYKGSSASIINFNFGTIGVRYITAFFSRGIGLSFLGTSFVFNVLGTIGLLAFDACLQKVTLNKTRNIQLLATIIVFLPSVSFWSSGIGKDAISFMAVGLAMWASQDIGRRIPLMTLAVTAMLLVRPHMAGLLIICIGFAAITQRRLSFMNKVLVSGIAVTAAAFLIPLALKYVGVSDWADTNELESYIETRQSYNRLGGSSLDITSMSLPMKLFSYLFRPVIFEARSIAAIAAAVDNLILLFLFIAGGLMLLKRKKHLHLQNSIFLWTYSLLAWFLLAMVTANMGIALRQKWMFAPMLILLFLSLIGRYRAISQDHLEPTPDVHKPGHSFQVEVAKRLSK